MPISCESTILPLFVLLMLLLTSTAASRKRRVRTNSLSHGSRTYRTEFPYVVSLQEFKKNRKNSRKGVWIHYCDGTIINPRVILTACYCLKVNGLPHLLRSPNTTRVVAGGEILEKSGGHEDVRNVKKIIPHPDCTYAVKGGQHWLKDVGLIELDDGFLFSYKIKSVEISSPLAERAQRALIRIRKKGETCSLPGWDRSNKAPYEHKLMTHIMELQPWKVCKAELCTPEYKAYCVIAFKEKKTCAMGGNFCDRTSGGPLICDGFLFGLVGFISHCGPGTPLDIIGLKAMMDMVNWKFDDEGHPSQPTDLQQENKDEDEHEM